MRAPFHVAFHSVQFTDGDTAIRARFGLSHDQPLRLVRNTTPPRIVGQPPKRTSRCATVLPPSPVTRPGDPHKGRYARESCSDPTRAGTRKRPFRSFGEAGKQSPRPGRGALDRRWNEADAPCRLRAGANRSGPGRGPQTRQRAHRRAAGTSRWRRATARRRFPRQYARRRPRQTRPTSLGTNGALASAIVIRSAAL